MFQLSKVVISILTVWHSNFCSEHVIILHLCAPTNLLDGYGHYIRVGLCIIIISPCSFQLLWAFVLLICSLNPIEDLRYWSFCFFFDAFTYTFIPRGQRSESASAQHPWRWQSFTLKGTDTSAQEWNLSSVLKCTIFTNVSGVQFWKLIYHQSMYFTVS